jgi:hypothetical protein
MFKAYASSESLGKDEEEKKPIVTSSSNNNNANGKYNKLEFSLNIISFDRKHLA